MYEYLGSLAAQLDLNHNIGHLVSLFAIMFIAILTAQIIWLLLAKRYKGLLPSTRVLLSFLGALLVGLVFYFVVESLMKAFTVYFGPVAYVAAIVWLLVLKNRIWRRIRQCEVETFNAKTNAPAAHE